MADVDPDDPELNEQLKQKIHQRFINQVGPFKVVDFLGHILTTEDIEHIKTCTRNDGNFVGAEELFSRLTQYKGWFDCIVTALGENLPNVAAKLDQDYNQVVNKLRTARIHEIHLKEGRGCLSLVDAASRGHVGCILDLLSGETDLNCKNENKESPVYLAAEGGHTECLEILIQAGCPLDTPNINSDTPLFVASKNGFPQCLKTLIEAIEKQKAKKGLSFYWRCNAFEITNNYGILPVFAAAARGHVECLEILVDAGANTSGSSALSLDGSCFTPLMAATLAGEEACVRFLAHKIERRMLEDRDTYGRTSLQIAAMEGRVKCMQALIEAGADVDTKSWLPPLYVAAIRHNPECARLLLSAGADVQRPAVSDGRTPLMMAAYCGDEECLQAFIEAGSNLNAQDNDGMTALMLASSYDICGQMLVENGADIHLRDKSGKNVLHHLADESYSLLLIMLIDLGTDINAADNLGETPLMIATRKCNSDVVQYLIMKGADKDKVNASGKKDWMIAQAELFVLNSQVLEPLLNTEKAEGDNTSVRDLRVADPTDEPSNITIDAAPVSEMDFVTLTRPHEMEFYIEHEDSLRDHYNDCQKNPGHVGFIPITEFNMSHLPEKYRDQRIFDVIQAEAELTVRLLVKYTSTARPDGYCNSKLRGTRNRRCGSGLITGLYGEFTLQKYVKCPCPVCETSGDPKMEWGKLAIDTAMHVVYDGSEAKETIVHLFVDVDRPDKMHKFYGYYVRECHQGHDRCYFFAATHDLRLYRYLKSMDEQRKEKWRICGENVLNKFVAIVSHPHGCSKQVTMGEWVERCPTAPPWPHTIDRVQSSYIYNVPTCPGSSGAPVIVFSREKSFTMHPHSGAERSGNNISGTSANLTITSAALYTTPSARRYPRQAERSQFTGKGMPKEWWKLFEQEVKRPKSPVQPMYDFQQRPPPS